MIMKILGAVVFSAVGLAAGYFLHILTAIPADACISTWAVPGDPWLTGAIFAVIAGFTGIVVINR